MVLIVKFNYIYLMQQIQGEASLNTVFGDPNLIISELQSVYDLSQPKQIVNQVKQTENPTTEGSQESQVLRVKTLSKKKLRRNLEISFEKYFLREHKDVFHQSYQNYVESIKFINDDEKIQSTPNTIFESQPHFGMSKIVNLLKANETKLSHTQIAQFFKDLQHEQNLHEFLNIVAQQSSPNLVMGFIQIAYYVWMKFVPNQHQDLKLSWLIQFGQEIGRQSTHNIYIKNWSFDLKEEYLVEQSFTELIQIYCVTLLLILCEYFQNPYYQRQKSQENDGSTGKRTFHEFIFSDSDDLSELQAPIISRKIRKEA